MNHLCTFNSHFGVVAQPSRLRVRTASRRSKRHGAGTPRELAGETPAPRQNEHCCLCTLKSFWRVALVVWLLLPEDVSAAGLKNGERSGWPDSVVTIEVSRNQYDYTQPWTRRTRRLRKTGIVLGDRRLLTTADQVFDQTLVRVQKEGRGPWWPASVDWVDYHANLAIVSCSNTQFWAGLKPVKFGASVPSGGDLQVLRWNDGNLEHRRADFLQFTVHEEILSPVSHVMLQASSDIQSAGWGEPLVAGSKVLGLLIAQDGRTCTATPAPFIQSILAARKAGKYRGIGYFHFYWMQAENPASLRTLQLTGPPRGVIVTSVPERPDGRETEVRPKDVILSIDGFALDIQGDYADPAFGHLMLENLATRNKWAGDDVKLHLLREGKEMDVMYRLPKYDYADSLVPRAQYGREPEYLVVGGLVFQPLTDSFLQSWGNEWKRRSPFRLYHYRSEERDKNRSGMVFLSQVLPDAYNIGYQDLKYLVLDKVNGQPVSTLRDLLDALRKPINGYHLVEFVQSDSLRRLVLEAGSAETEATARVLKRYGVPEAARVFQH
jgi:hypothetical protein